MWSGYIDLETYFAGVYIVFDVRPPPLQVRCSQRHIEDVCNISRFESKKRRGHSPGNKFPSCNLNQPAREGVLSCLWEEALIFNKNVSSTLAALVQKSGFLRYAVPLSGYIRHHVQSF